MKLYWGAASPYVRKVLVCAHELGLAERIERLDSAAHPVDRDLRIQAVNPLAKVPAAQAADGTPLYDSRVICEYLAAEAGDQRLFPPPGPARWRALRQQALGDGLLDAALLIRYERLARPEETRCERWIARQTDKITDALDALQDELAAAPERIDIGTITAGCALGYLDFRFPDLTWCHRRPGLSDWYESFAARPAMQATRPQA